MLHQLKIDTLRYYGYAASWIKPPNSSAVRLSKPILCIYFSKTILISISIIYQHKDHNSAASTMYVTSVSSQPLGAALYFKIASKMTDNVQILCNMGSPHCRIKCGP